MDIPYVNVHCHQRTSVPDVIEIQNRFPGQVVDDQPEGTYSVGIHPWYINPDALEQEYKLLELHIRKNECLAIGETGLDRITDTPFELQEEVFEKQLDIAEKAQKPVIIHCVKAYSEIIRIRKPRKSPVPWIIHGFSENETIGSKLISMGCYLSFGNLIARKESKAARTLEKIDLKHVFFETDDQDDMSIKHIYQRAAAILGQKEEDVRNSIFDNYNRIFS